MGIKEFSLTHLNSKNFKTQGIPHNANISVEHRKHTHLKESKGKKFSARVQKLPA